MTSNQSSKIALIIQKISEMDNQLNNCLDRQDSLDHEMIFWMVDERQKMVKYFEGVLTQAADNNSLSKEETNMAIEFITHILDRDDRIIEKLQVIKSQTKQDVAKIKQGKKAMKSYDGSPT